MEQMANSTPIVDLDSMPKSLLVNLDRIQLNFPTPEAPINTPLSRSSYSSPACVANLSSTHSSSLHNLAPHFQKPIGNHPPTHTFTKTHNPHSHARKKLGTYNRSTNGGASVIGLVAIYGSITSNLPSAWALMVAGGIMGRGPSRAWLLRGIWPNTSFSFCNIIFYI